MSKVTFGKVCPHCGRETFHRIGRSWWMRFIPGSRHYHCVFCYSRFVAVEASITKRNKAEATDSRA